jgi:enediyne polyketide synthase
VAVVGMACWYPGARDLRQFWENVLARRRQFRRFPDRRLPLSDYHDPAPRAPDKTYATRGAFIDGFEFDWVGRRIPQKTYESTDVVHWLALEVALKALEDAGYTPETVATERSAALVGNSLTGEETRSRYMRLRWPFVRRVLRATLAAKGLPDGDIHELEETMESTYKSVFPPVTEDTLAGAMSNTIAGRICNFLDFQGGGYIVDGACASGMIAVATAATALTNGDIDVALAGGVDISLDAMELIGFAKVGALTRDDMNVYDKRGSGFIPGEGCGFVMLKRLEDARRDGDFVYAVVRGWGISSDGSGGLTAPRADSQAKMIERAYERAGYSSHEIAFVEGHGTATVAGDKAELEGIQLALSADGEPQPRSVGMTSFKSLIGHTKAASGIAGFIKAVMAVNRRVLPPFAGHKTPNPVFGRTAHALYPILHGEVRDPGETIRAGASAMGFGGINCHVALESGDAPADTLAPSIDERVLMASAQETELFPLTASSIGDLLRRAQELAVVAADMSIAELTDLAAELAGALEVDAPVRAAVVAGTPSELSERLQQLEALLAESPPAEGDIAESGREVVVANAVRGVRIGFLFPGQGSQQLDMARVLVERHDWARELVDRSDAWLREAGSEPVGELIYRRLDPALNRAQVDEWSAALAQTEVAQPAICLASLLWLGQLARLGLKPAAVAGHSLGELSAFHAAGAFDEQALLKLAAIRGRAMAAPVENAGAMAALGCSRERADELVARASGYIVVANVNSPVQVVVSGDRAAVEEVTALAEAEELQARLLPVSNAFHSARVEAAAEQLRADAPVPERLQELDTVLVTGIGGREILAGTDLRAHFAGQVLAQVDFVSVAENLAKRCDILVEVGPGRVLSGLVRATVGADGPPSLPVESEPGADRDLNVVLASVFVRGAEIQWEELYSGRLVRPFVPASELRFIENPLELPLDIPDGRPAGAPPSFGPTMASPLAGAAGLTEAELADYLARRGRFLGQVISADLGTPVVETGPSLTVEEPRTVAAPSAIGARLVELAAELTGFPPETIPLEARLLDDLNLDSIKAGELVTRAADEYGAGELEIGPLANAALSEVAEAIRAALPSDGDAAPAASAVLFDVVARATGFPPETITPDLRLLDDLNLDSIKAAEVVLETAGQLGIGDEAVPDPSTFANASLAELAEALDQVSRGRPTAAAARVADSAFESRPSWVREFIVEDVEAAIADGEAENLATAKALVLFEDGDEDLAAATSDEFAKRGAEVMTAQFAEARERGLCDDEAVTHVVALLPRRPAAGAAPEVTLRQAVERLRTPVATAQPGDERTLVYVQVGGPSPPAIEQSCAAAFAASVHHERPDLRVRVIDAAPEIEPAALADRLLAELATPDAYVAAGYDASLTRCIPIPRVQDPVDYPARPISWSAEDVVIATGGAKGITAECALALARATGAALALVGSSAPPAGSDGGEIAGTLARFEQEGLRGRYYQCDIGDPGAVESLVEQVRADLGEITGVIHGAGANTPRRVEQVDAESAAAEAAPKVLGALNLCRTLGERPPKLFVGFSSITGVTGMPGNSWYGFANEALELTLRRFGAEHPETAAVSIAFSIWGEVGMGARMGSAEQLGRMGVAAIPTEEGVRRFLRLVEHDPGDSRVVVAARLRGLDTWLPRSAPPPSADRFLENLLHVEPGVEVVARPRLSLERDSYLRDHVYKGSPLFPTVFGLEAMAQAVALAAGRSELGALRIEDVILERPVVVDPAQGAELEVRAEVLERDEPGSERRVRAAIGTAQTGFAVDHFSATFVLGIDADAPVEKVDLPPAALDIRPDQDLYGRLLFQGPTFQRLLRVYSLDSGACVFVAEERETEEPYLLGDPFFRDTVLHGAQLVVPQSVCLPVHLGSIEMYPTGGALPASRIVRIVNEGRVDEYENARVVVVDEHGRVVQRLERYRLRILERLEDNPTAEAIADPGERDDDLLRQELVARARRVAVRAPEPTLAYLGDLHSLSADERHELEQPLFREALARFFENGGDES